MSRRRLRGFTLVELLVVIGIIALLISILLPALNSARRSAATVKCASALREIGNAFKLYEMENRGYAPATKLAYDSGTYNLNGTNYPAAPYWFDFLAKYVTKAKMGNSATTTLDGSQQLRTVFWGCPAWDSYTASASTATGINGTQPGYGMNAAPEYQPDYPAATPPFKELGESPDPYLYKFNTPHWTSTGLSATNHYAWYKLRTWGVHAQDRALAGDCLFWLMESRPPTATLNPNVALPGQYFYGNLGTWSGGTDGAHQSTFDWYRHGKAPGMMPGSTDELNPSGGKVSYNILFADGHVANSVDKRDAYKVVRMKFPG